MFQGHFDGSPQAILNILHALYINVRNQRTFGAGKIYLADEIEMATEARGIGARGDYGSGESDQRVNLAAKKFNLFGFGHGGSPIAVIVHIVDPPWT
jgi:hypothetical protein